MQQWFRRRWAAACRDTIGSETFWAIAVDHAAIRRSLGPLIERYAKGCVLDAGAGRLAWHALLTERATALLSTDAASTHPRLSFVCDLTAGIPLRDGSLDTIFCCSVIEHTAEPWRLLPEFRRVLRPGGHVILSAPFLYYLHGIPQDYFRFTAYGVRRLAERAGLDVVELSTSGGLCHTLSHAASMLVAALLWTPRAPFLVTAPARALFAAARLIDGCDRQGLFRQTVNAVLRAPV